ncbi:MAG: ABC transporter ATP-binding protein [Candidatus Methanomethylophilaceae archaeon]|nr:ABC transporter ATP-binding protein [Candidatus Methanomethylophilaceae archaeon]
MFFRYFTGKEWAYVVLCTACIVFQVYLDLRIPEYMNDITYAIQTGGGQELVAEEGYGMIACALLSLVSSVGAGFFAARFAASFTRNLRLRMFSRVQDLSSQDISEISAASLVTRSTNDPYQLQNFFGRSLQVIVKSPILATWAVLKISGSNWEWTSITIAGVLVIMATIAVVMWCVMKFFRRIQWLKDDVNREVRENLTGSKVIRAYNAEGYRTSKFDDASKALLDNNVSIFARMAPMGSMSNTVINIMTIAIYWSGALMLAGVSDQESKFQMFSDMIVFSSYALQVMTAFMMFTGVIRGFPSAKVAYGRMTEIIEREKSVPEGSFDGETASEGEIEFRNVTFTYPGRRTPALEDVSFRIGRGQTLAVLGSTGSGKSTLIKLILRQYDPDSGQVLVDGRDVKDYTRRALYSRLGYVPQTPIIFTGTVEYNVNYGETASSRTHDDVLRALRIAQAEEFVSHLPEGTETMLSQYGKNVSGGQKQRLTVARAICKDPEALLLDDSFSALDFKTDRALRQSLKASMAGTTKVIVAQRVGTVMDADLIIVLDDGKAVGMGTHKELMESCRMYRDTAIAQMEERRCRRDLPAGPRPRSPRTSGRPSGPSWSTSASTSGT